MKRLLSSTPSGRGLFAHAVRIFGYVGLLTCGANGCSTNLRSLAQLKAASTTFSLVAETGAASALKPTFSLHGVTTGDQVLLLQSADATCAGGQTVGDGYLTTNASSIGLTSDTFVTEPTVRSYRAKITRSGNSYCSNAVELTSTAPSDFVAVSAGGGSFACALRDLDGNSANGHAVFCWGSNSSGQLGVGDVAAHNGLVRTGSFDDAVGIAVASSHACALHSDGTVSCWGSGQLGDGATTSSSTPVTVSGVSTATQISAGYTHMCATLADNSLRCWGTNTSGSLGNGSTITSNTPVTVTGISTAASVHGGYNRTCAILQDGTIRCWGAGTSGQLGDGGTSDSSTSVLVSGLSGVDSLTVDFYASCATKAGATYCWGSGYTSTPAVVAAAAGLTGLSSNVSARCGTTSDDRVSCWGLNTYRRLGQSAERSNSITTPIIVDEVTDAQSVSVGGTIACAIDSTRRLKCWGGNLDNRSTNLATEPLLVAKSHELESLRMTGFSWCGILKNGHPACWGYGYGKNLGTNDTNFASIPTEISDISGATYLSRGTGYYDSMMGMFHGDTARCAVDSTGAVWCWGVNSYGQLGLGTTTASETPTLVPGLSSVARVETTYSAACAVKTDGTVACWGRGPIGDGGSGNSSTPYTVPGVSNVKSLAIYREQGATGCYRPTYAVHNDGTVTHWGTGFGSNLTPAVTGITDVKKVVANCNYACALKNDGTVWCWGQNTLNQLGDGTGTNSLTTPVQAVGLTDAIDIETNSLPLSNVSGAHFGFTCAATSAGTVKCWGIGAGINSATPTTVAGLSDAVEIQIGLGELCIRRKSGAFQCRSSPLLSSSQMVDGAGFISPPPFPGSPMVLE